MTSKLFIHPVTFVNTNDAISPSDPDASVTISGGIAVQKTAYFATKIYTDGLDANNTVITQVSTPIAATDAANKSYVDGITISTDFSIENNANVLRISSSALGTGLTGGSGVTISVSTTQSFSNLTVTTLANFSGITVNGIGTPSAATDAANKSYVDGIVSTAGTGLTKTINVFSVNASQTQITSVGTLTGLTVSGATSITNTTQSTSSITGALITAGGLGIAKNAYIGGNLNVTGSITSSTTAASLYRLSITDGLESSSTTTGALNITGGVGIAKKLFVGGTASITDTTKITDTVNPTTSAGGALNVDGDVVLAGTTPRIYFPTGDLGLPTLTNRSIGTKLVLFPAISAGQVDHAIGTATNTFWSSVPSSGQNFTWYAGTTNVMTLSGTGVLTTSGAHTISNSTKVGVTVNPTTSTGGALNVDGDVVLDATSPKIFFPSDGDATPTFTNRSTGTKLVLYPQMTGTTTDFAIGIEPNTMWFNCSEAISTRYFKWYAGTTEVMKLTGIGDLSISGTSKIANTVNPTTSLDGALNILGDIVLDTDYPRIYFPTGLGVGLPSFTNRSIGSKLVLWPSTTGTSTDIAIGVHSNTMWFSTQEANASNTFKWFSGTTNVMTLTGSGNLTISGSIQGNLQLGYTTTVTSATLVTLTMASNSRQFFTGVLDQIVRMPNPIGELLGTTFEIINRSSANITVQSNDTNEILGSSGSQGQSIGPLDSVKFTLIDDGTNNSNSWYAEFLTVGSQISNITNTTESSSSTTGSLITSGGIGIGKSLHVGNGIHIRGNTIAASEVYELLLGASTSNTVRNYSSRIWATTATGSNFSSDLNFATHGVLTASEPILALTIDNVQQCKIVTTTDSVSSSTGALIVDGGVGIAKSLRIGGQFTVIGNPDSAFINVIKNTSTGTSAHTYLQIVNDVNVGINLVTTNTNYSGGLFSTITSSYNLTVGGSGNLTLTSNGSSKLSFVGDTATFNSTTKIVDTFNPNSATGGAVNLNGDLVLAASVPRIYFPVGSFGSPSFTNRSIGTKLVLYPTISATKVDYSMGIGALSDMWFSIPENTDNYSFNWYGGTTNIMSLDGIGNLSTSGTIKSNYYLDSQGYHLTEGTFSSIQGYIDLVATSERIRVPRGITNNAISTWTLGTSAADNDWVDIIWVSELGLFVSLAANTVSNAIMTSPDGKVWTTRTTAENNLWRRVTWSPQLNLLVAVSETGTNRVMTSPDAITWTSRSAAAANVWKSVCWSPELQLFAAVSNTGSADRVMTSPDGTNWTSQTTVDNLWTYIIWVKELLLFVAIAFSGTNRAMTSPDGINWTTQAIPSEQYLAITYSPELGLLVAVNDSSTGSRVTVSQDAINWTAVSTPADYIWSDLTWSPELSVFVSVATDGSTNHVMSSYDGYNWTLQTTPNRAYKCICWSADLSIFVTPSISGTGDRVTTSDFGIPTIKNLVSASNLTYGTNIDIIGNTINVIDAPTFDGIVNIANTVDAVSTTTGAVVVSGGIGVAKNAHIGQDLFVGGYIKKQGTGDIKTRVYCHSSNIANTGPGVTVFNIVGGTGISYFGKVTIILEEASNNDNVSILTFEISGRTNKATVWNIIENHPANSYPMGTTVAVGDGTTSHSFTVQPVSTRTYDIRVKVELFGGDATLTTIVIDGSTAETFTY